MILGWTDNDMAMEPKYLPILLPDNSLNDFYGKAKK
jgi:hypothetical protein